MFNSLADEESGVKYWSEGSLCRFLELPDVLGVGPVIYAMAAYLGAFPFPSQAPCIVTKEALLKVVTIMTQRYMRVLKRGNRDRLRLLYGSLAVFDRRASECLHQKPTVSEPDDRDKMLRESIGGLAGFAIDEPANDGPENEDEDDDEEEGLALAALDSMDAIEAISLGERPNIRHSIIPSDNFRRLVELMLLIAPLGPQENLATFAVRLTEPNIVDLRRTAGAILSLFGVEDAPGITYANFRDVVPSCMPFLFDGLNPLFEHFLFQKDFDLSKRRHSRTVSMPTSSTSPVPTIPEDKAIEPFPSMSSPIAMSPSQTKDPFPFSTTTPLLPDAGELLTINTLSQLSFFLEPSTLFRRMHFLYSGSTHGFSMGSFEKAVFTWKSPTIVLVSGTLLPNSPSNSQERAFFDALPSRRFPPSTSTCQHQKPPEQPSSPQQDEPAQPQRVIYGAYLPIPIKATHRTPLSHPSTLLFQLHPTHDVFRASDISTNHLTFVAPGPGAQHAGIALGCPLPVPHPSPGTSTVPLGPVSLYLDDALAFGVMTHTSAGGGSFHPSGAPVRRGKRGRDGAVGKGDWQDIFEVEAVEVWGLGGEEQVQGRRRTLEFEEREARLRREGRSGSVSKGAAGVEADRELLRMAGLVGHAEGAGGSMG